jgi:PRTRC genetic system protein E
MPMSDGENVALTTLMSFTGTATELDDQLPNAIAAFVASHLELNDQLATSPGLLIVLSEKVARGDTE